MKNTDDTCGIAKQLLMGIDIGTSACKVVVFNRKGTVIAESTGAYKVYYPQEGWAEQNPEEWWSAVCEAIRTVLAKGKIDPAQIAGIGVDGQSWSAIAIDSIGTVLCNTPIWMDTRASEICDELSRNLDTTDLFERCGNPLQPAYTLPKILWYKKYMPNVYSKTDKILQSNSFIVYRLTGVVTQDISQAYGLQCFNMHSGEWDKELCARLGIDACMLPSIVPCHSVVGVTSEKAAQNTGLCAGIPVVAGGLDAACGALGAGVIHPGETQEQGGQAGGMSICIDNYSADPRLILGYHVVPYLWLLQGGTVGGGGSLKWFEEQFGESERVTAQANSTSPFYEMDKLAGQITSGSDGVIFLPYMAGERSPIWDKKAKGVYYGLDFAKTRAHLIRATMEGVAYSLRHNLETAAEAGANTEVLYAIGGAANSNLWTQIKADVTGKRIVVPASDTATALGAAMLAGVGTGVYRDFQEAVDLSAVQLREHIPDMQNHSRYNTLYKKYIQLYEQLKCIMNGDDEE